MHRRLILSAAALLLALPCAAAEIAVSKSLTLDIDLARGWSLSLEPPQALVEETARQIAREPEAAKASAMQIESAARKRLAVNEAFVCHAASGACLTIDFSPLRPGEAAPGASSLRYSARAAAESLASEEDVAEVSWEVTPCKVEGAGEAFQLSADYRKHGRPIRFLGVIGYVDGSWFFLYFTDPGADPAVFAEMQAMLKQASVQRTGH
jgi:hypothetical protein